MLLGIDIGGTTITLGLVDGKEIVKKVCIPSFEENATLDQTLDYLVNAIDGIITPEVSTIGIGVPTLVDPDKGIVYDAMNIPSWKEVHLKDLLEKRFGIPVSVNNDANCYALGAEALSGGGHHVLVCITLGTGTGVGIVADGKLLCGDNCGAGELCSIPYNGADYETFCSKKFFTANGREGREAGNAAEAGDPATLAFFDEFGRHLGELLSLVMYAYDPGCIVLGGGIAHTHPWFEASMLKTLREKYIYPHVLDKLRIEFMPDADTALLGASLL